MPRADASALLSASLEGAEFPTEAALETETGPENVAVSAPTPADANTQVVQDPLPVDPVVQATPPPSKPLPRQGATLPLVDRVATPLDINSADLANAGKNLKAIYRGLRDVLRTGTGTANPATPARDDKPSQQ